MVFSYYDWLLDQYAYWEDYYDDFYENDYWPKHYGVYNISNSSWCDYIHQSKITHNNTYHNDSNLISPSNTTDVPLMTTLEAQSTHFITTLFNCTQRYNGTFPPSLYKWEQWWYNNINTIGISMTFISCFLSILSIIIAVLFFIRLKGAMKKVIRPNTFTICVSSVCICAHMGFIISDSVSFYFWYIQYDLVYKDIEILWEILWMVAKVSIYSLFAYRYYILQNASMKHSTSKKRKTLLFGTIIAAILSQIVLEIIYGYYKFDYLRTEDKMKKRKYLNAAWAVMIIDFVLVCFLGVLIMKTILDLVGVINERDRPSKGSDYSAGSSVVSSTEMQTMKGVNTVQSVSSKTKTSVKVSEKRKKRSSKQVFIQTTTRIALTCTLSLISSLTVQFLWILMGETENYRMLWTAWLWGFDGIINMICVYFSMAFAKEHYQILCGNICKCHYCYLWCIMRIISCRSKQQKKEIRLDSVVVSDVSPLSPTKMS